MRVTRCLVISLAIGVLAIMLAGCRSTDSAHSSAVDQKPWNAPSAWEGMIWGVPY